MPEIISVDKRSPADRAGIKAGDWLLDIDGHPINDVLDYNFRITEKKITVRCHRGPDILTFVIRKDRYSDLGLNFTDYLMDKQRRCSNKCIFCFIDQNPCGMRESIYFKDDDSRMSFLSGSYVTLTNMSDGDIDRICEMHLSPINVSVHTTDPELRVKMMGNPRAALIMEQLRKLAGAGIRLHCQIVCCRGINDGEALDRTMRELAGLYPEMESCGIVPCGLTRYREKLPYIKPFDAEASASLVKQVESFAENMYRAHGEHVFFVGDEAYVKAALPLPPPEYYEGFPMIEDGIGGMASLEEETVLTLGDLTEDERSVRRKISVATGEAAYDFIRRLTDMVKEHVPGFSCRVYCVKNDFYGGGVTVAGLITGQDIIYQLNGQDLGEELILPAVALRYERDKFLDDVTPEDISRALGVKVSFAESSGESFVGALLGTC